MNTTGLFVICMSVRLWIAYLAKVANLSWLRIMGYIAILPVVGFLYIFLTGSRMTGAEAAGGKIWWNRMRPIHAFMYSLFAYFAITGNRNAWVYLFADVILGLIAFVWFHSRNGDFSKAFL